jgi:hypothetical protein
MTKPNVLDGNEVREMTDAEYAQWQTDNEAHAAQAAAVEAQAAARASALAKLADLGLTDDEISALVG